MTRVTKSRDQSWQILREVVERLDPFHLIADSISVDPNGLTVRGVDRTVPLEGRLVVLAVGKASVPMAAGALSVLQDRVDRSIAITKSGLRLTVDPPQNLEICYADHPVPSESSLDAGRIVLDAIYGLDERDVVLMLISGGGSALMEDLVDGVTLEQLQATTEVLLRSGATINELNAVRRELSTLKGGKLAQTIAPAKVVNLVISDVLGNPLQDIASGPTVEPPDSTDQLDAVLRRSEVAGQLPEPVLAHLRQSLRVHREWNASVAGTTILADAETAARFAVESAHRHGYVTQTIGFDFEGEACEFGRTFGTLVRHARTDRRAFRRPLALIGSGELTVTVHGDGSGGRNTEMALAAAREIDGLDGATISSFATDGDDGSSGFAGAMVDGATMSAIRSRGIDVDQHLADNDSAPVCRAVGAEIEIGPTGTNVNDLYLALIED